MTPEERECFLRLLALSPPGPRIEFGVLSGSTLRLMADHGGPTIGVDSFVGMPEPSNRDIKDGCNPYPKGRLAVSKQTVEQKLLDCHNITLVVGFVPDILEALHHPPYGFAHVDMDHYESTSAALEWLWPRMTKGGIICCDDYIKSRDWLAAGAINEFAKKHDMAGVVGKKAWFVR